MNGEMTRSTKKRGVIRAVLAMLAAKNVHYIDVYIKMYSSQPLKSNLFQNISTLMQIDRNRRFYRAGS